MGRPFVPVRVLVLVLAFGTTSCHSSIDADTGRDALIQVEGAQFFRGPLPPEGGGPKVLSATLAGRMRAGRVDQACSGDLETPATAVAIGLESDVGYWVVPAKVPLASAPTSPTFDLVFGVSASTSLGSRQVALRAIDAQGAFGPPLLRPLEIIAVSRPTGRFVVSLSWGTQADLDLHVVLPSGLEIFKRNRTEYQRPPPSAGPVLPGTPKDGGVLDRDSNADCVQDGQRNENVVWSEPPPKGHYVVRVDTFSLCGAAYADWRVEAVLDGVRIGAAQGMATDNDLRFDHNRGGGVLALEVDVP